MSIVVSCACGQRFAAQPHLAGQIVTCPVCGQGISVPLAQAPAPQAHDPPTYPQQPAPGYGPPRTPAYRPPQPARAGGGPLLYLGIGCGVLVLFAFAAVAVTLIGYDLARTTLKKKPAEAVVRSPPSEASKPAAATNKDQPAVSPLASLPRPGLPPSSPPRSPLPFNPSLPPLQPGEDRLAGPVVVFQMLDYQGGRESGGAAHAALASISWFNGAVVVNHSTGEVIVGVRGQSVNTGQAKAALEAAGFKIGTTTYKPSGR